MATEPIHILLVEEDPEKTRTIWNMLHEKSRFRYVIEAVTGLPHAIERLITHNIDVVLLDLSLVSHEEETEVIRTFFKAQPHMALLVITKLEHEEAGLRALEAGAQDYLLKEELGTRTLVRALHYAVERQRAGALVREASERHRTAANSILDYAIISLDTEGRIIDWNAGAQHIFGYQAAEVVGEPFDFLFTLEDRAAGIPAQEIVKAREQKLAEDERWHVRKDGSRFYASGMVRPMLNDTTVIGFTKVCRDMTKQKQAEEERARLLLNETDLRTRAETAHAMRIKFTAMIAHELRNPLTTIKGFASTLRATDVTFTAEDEQEFLKLIEEETDRATKLIDQLLDATQIETGTLRITPQPETLANILRSAQSRLQTVTPARELTIELPPDLPPVLADKDRISQVLVNLVGNAAKFSATNTPIRIKVEPAGQFVRVEVADEGPGIPLEKHETVFAVFEQLEHSQTAGKKGLGLGLAICKGVVEAHGGKIWVEPTATGTTMAFTLPVA